MRIVLGLMLLGLSVSALAVKPETGMWWTPTWPGTGVYIEEQGGVYFVTLYTYKESGEAAWYTATGQLDESGVLEVPLLEYAGGQCPGCDYRENTLVGEAHTIRLHVRAKRHITMTLNDTVESELQRFNYGVGDIGTPYRYFDRRFPDVR